jgi:putative holliday junction resolvase
MAPAGGQPYPSGAASGRFTLAMRILGVDPGEKRIGIAISDPGGRIAVPVKVYERGRETARELGALAQREEAQLIVVGLALRLDGTAGTQAERARRFGRELQAASGIPVVFWDERFSTHEAGRLLLDSGGSRRRRKAALDAAAATVILQDYLDCHEQAPPPNSFLEDPCS